MIVVLARDLGYKIDQKPWPFGFYLKCKFRVTITTVVCFYFILPLLLFFGVFVCVDLIIENPLTVSPSLNENGG